MRRTVFLSLIIIMLLFFPLPVAAADTAAEPDLSDLEEAVEELDADLAETMSSFSLKDLYNAFRGGDFSFDLAAIFQSLLAWIFREARSFLSLLGQLLLLGMTAAVFHIFEECFEGKGVAKVGQWVIFLAFILVAVKTFRIALDLGSETIHQAADFLCAVLPVVLGAFALTGSAVSAAVVQPSILAVISIFLGLTERFFLPLVLIMAVLAVTAHLSPAFSFQKLFSLIRDVILVCLGLMMTIFTGIIGLESFAAGTIDGLTLKTVKMATGNFIPVVGGYIADAFDSLLGASLLLRNGIGIFGSIAVILVIALPAIRILLMSLLFKLAAAILQPFGDNEFVATLSDFASVLVILFAIVAAAGVLFFFLIFCIVGLSSVTMMFR
jgi:stage III sporulation protein AE